MPPTTRTRVPKPVVGAVVQAATPKKRASTAKTVENGAVMEPQAAADSSPATKKRKVTPKEPKAVPPPRPPIDLSQVHYKPSILPVEPKFSVQAAMDHLIQFDPRFKGLFNAMKCRPFVEPFEALDPYRTLTTSIVGQQVSLYNLLWKSKLTKQVSWMAARAINNRFRGLFGYKEDDEEGFPSPADVYKKDVLVLKSAGLSMRKAEYGEFRISLECI